jgi:hypothetical protein
VTAVTGGPNVCYETERNARFIAFENLAANDTTIQVWVF